MVSGVGDAVVSDIDPIIKAADKKSTTTAVSVQTADGLNIFRATGDNRVLMNNDLFVQSATPGPAINTVVHSDWHMGTSDQHDMFLMSNGHTALHIHKSGGVTVGQGTDPGAGNLSIQGGYTGSIRTGQCEILVKGGIITAISGQCSMTPQ
jgi:hypothetical protein